MNTQAQQRLLAELSAWFPDVQLGDLVQPGLPPNAIVAPTPFAKTRNSEVFLVSVASKVFAFKVWKTPAHPLTSGHVEVRKQKTTPGCSNRNAKIGSFSSNPLFNEILIGTILTGTLKSSFPFYLKVFQAVWVNPENKVQKRVGLVSEYCDLGTLREFIEKNETSVPCLDILSQLLIGLAFLREKFAFESRDLNLSNVLVTSEPVALSYRGLSVSSPFTVKIADFGRSSLIFKEYRLSRRRKARGFRPLFQKTTDTTYVLRSGLEAAFNKPYQQDALEPSFDFYTILVALMTLEPFRNCLLANNWSFWVSLWDSEASANKMLLRVERAKKDSLTFYDLVSLLTGMTLKCRVEPFDFRLGVHP